MSDKEGGSLRVGDRSWRAGSWRRPILRFLDQSDHVQQDDGPDGGRDQAPDQATGKQSKRPPEEPAPYEGSNHAYNQISDEAVAAASYDVSGKPAGSNTNDEKPQEMHIALPSVRAV
ncbi:MAG: hypothetical protein WAJ87_11885 [Bryobacteraceae bacterium]